MSCSDSKKSKKRKSNKSGNMGDVLGKECGDGEKDKLQQGTCEENVREEADGAPSGDEHSSQSSGETESYEVKQVDEVKGDTGQLEQNTEMSVIPAGQREEKPCTCEACKDRREVAAEQLEEMRRLQSYWMELRQYIRMVYRMAMEGRTAESGGTEGYEAKMKELVHKLCARDPHQLFQRLESQVQEFVIEAKVRQLELLHREQQTPELAQIFLTGLLEGFDKLCLAAKQLAPLLQQLETEHLQRFNLTWEVLNKHLYQSCVYTDPLVQNNLPHYIGQLRNMLPGKNEAYSELVHHYLAFDDEMTLIGAMWRDTETLVHEYNQEQATLKAKQRMLREDWELFKAQRKLIQQKMWNKTASELREFDEQLMSLASMAGPGPGPESPRNSSPEEGSANGTGFCLGCSSRRGCPCDECAMTHLLTCGGLITPPDSPGPLYSHKMDVAREYRVEGEGSEQPPASPSEPDIIGESVLNGGDADVIELTANQQQSCECHVCTAPTMSPMDLMESYECHTCVQQGVPLPGSSSAVNLNLHAGGFHLYPHIHGTGGGGDAGSLYPHLYNIHPSLLTQLGTKHSRLGVHLQDQLQLTSSDPKTQHLMSPPTSSVTDLLPPGLTLEALPISTTPCLSTIPSTAASFSTPAPIRPKPAPSPTSPSSAAKPLAETGAQQHKQPVSPIPAKGSGQCKYPGGHNPLTSASTQTSPSKAKAGVATSTSLPHGVGRQLSQSLVKRVGMSNQSQGHHHPVVSRSSPNLGSSSVRHSMTQTANSTTAGHNHVHPHPLLPDVVKSAATSTTSHRPPSKVPAHSCHKSLKNGGSMEPIKRVACTDYPDSEVVDLEDSSSQDDTCSERSSSTTTSTQRDSRHCDCCYCEVFGHGMPSVAPVSRNYQEMRERLRLLLTKKKAKCKIGPGTASPSQAVATGPQASNTEIAAAKPTVPIATPSPSAPATAPVLTKQDSADSLLQPTKDPRDLEALLDFIEGNQSGRCKDAKKAAKKARQKQKKLEEKEKKDQEEAERLRGLEELQNNTPEVTITVVNTPGGAGTSAGIPPCSGQPSGKTGKSSKREEEAAVPMSAPEGSGKAVTVPQMVTIKRVMESNGAEPTVTITLKGATPDKDKVLFTLVNGQGDYLCQSQEEAKAVNQQPLTQGSKNNTNNSINNVTNGKKKKSKGGNSSQQNSTSSITVNKSQHSIAKSTIKPSTVPSVSCAKPTVAVPVSKTPQAVQTPALGSTRPAMTPTATQLNGVFDGMKGAISTSTSRSFSLENLKLPPGITITKVDGPMAAAAAQRKSQLKAAEKPKAPISIAPSNGSTTIIAAPTSVGNPNRLAGYGQAVNGSNVIVVDTGRMKEELESSTTPSKDHSEDSNGQNSGNGKKKNKKKNKTGNQENGTLTTNCNVNGNPSNKPQQRQQQTLNGNQINGKQQNSISSKIQSQSNITNMRPHSTQQQAKVNGRPLVQPAIIKMNGSMVTIRNPALQQSMSATGARFTPSMAPQLNGQSEVQMNGDISVKNGSVKPGKKAGSSCSPTSLSSGGIKGKENSSTPPRFAGLESAGAVLRNGLNGLHVGKLAAPTGRGDEGRVTVRSGNGTSTLPPRMRPLQQQVQKVMQSQNHVQDSSLQHPTAARAVMQAREAMAAANDAKKKKKKKKCSGSQGHADDWTLVESVFAPKDIDLENGDIDDDERELEAFKRFCFNSVPPKRKEKVHLNIKDIVLKKKSSAIGCS